MFEQHNQYTPRYGPHDRGLRAADSDREAVADLLREQHVAGRIDSDEHQERIERCYAAKTYADLDAIVADLPHDEPRVTQARGLWLWPRFAFLALLLIAIVAVSHGHLSWLAIPLAFFFVVRPLMWRASSGRFGWGPVGCGSGHSTYV
jgi:hypothetical protein